MKESARRQQLLDLLSPLHAVAVENSLGSEAGTPDMNCVAGWIEVKQIDDWPKKLSTIVQPRHFEPEQRLWLTKRCEAGGRAWVLLCVGSEWCLCWGTSAAKHLGVSWTRLELSGEGHVEGYTAPGVIWWRGIPSSRDLIKALLIRHWA